MEMSDLIAYAEKEYQIQEEHKWTDFPGFSVLCHPDTGKWAVLLMRQWDSDTGTEVECCDIKCGRDCLKLMKPYLKLPVRMKGPLWVNVSFGRETEDEEVFHLLDLAMEVTGDQGFKIILDQTLKFRNTARETEIEKKATAPEKNFEKDLEKNFEKALEKNSEKDLEKNLEKDPEKNRRIQETTYQDTEIDFSRRPEGLLRPLKEEIPEKIRDMRRLYRYNGNAVSDKARNFYTQGKFMEDYEDDVPWRGDFFRYFPSYHDLTIPQLRGYFNWRGKVRKGIYDPVPSSLAYIYLYELINTLGVASPEEALEKMQAFEKGYLDQVVRDEAMRKNLHRWREEYAILQDLPPEKVREFTDSEDHSRDLALTVLKNPLDHSDDRVFEALAAFEKKLKKTPVFTLDNNRGSRLFASLWRYVLSETRQENSEFKKAHSGLDLFEACFGEKKTRRWYPLGNTLYYRRKWEEERVYTLNDNRIYRCHSGLWSVESYEKLYFDLKLLQGFLHEADLLLRQYLKTGRPLKEKWEDKWAAPMIRAFIETDRKRVLEESRPKINLDLSNLDKIRRDAEVTRDSLLTDEELQEIRRTAPVEEAMRQEDMTRQEDTTQQKEMTQPEETENDHEDLLPSLPLDPVHTRILLGLLKGRDIRNLIKENHLMPSLAADTINEAMFDDIGDNIVLSDDDSLSLVEDYREDIEFMLGETYT